MGIKDWLKPLSNYFEVRNLGIIIKLKKKIPNTPEITESIESIRHLFQFETEFECSYSLDNQGKNITEITIAGYGLRIEFENDVFEEELRKILKSLKIEFNRLEKFEPKPRNERIQEVQRMLKSHREYLNEMKK